jgi:hypothetical protein
MRRLQEQRTPSLFPGPNMTSHTNIYKYKFEMVSEYKVKDLTVNTFPQLLIKNKILAPS